MKIIHVTDELMPSAGGLVSVPINLAAAQAGEGHDVILLGRTGKEELLASGETSKVPYFKQVTVADAGQPGLAAKLFPRKSLNLLKQHITKGSVVHLHGVWDPVLLFASLIARRVGAVYIVTPHSMLHPWQMERFVLQKKIVFAIGWRNMFNKAAFIHVLNTAEAQFVRAFYFKAPMEVIPNGVYQESLAPVEPNPFLVNHPGLKETGYILFLSRLSSQKGLTYLLQGFEIYAEQNTTIRLVIAGPDYGELPVIEELLSKMKYTDRVLLIGSIYGDEKIGALHGASCFALTSLNEGFSVALLEALACGLPAVISERCFFPEVEQAGAGLITDLDPISISNAFKKIFDSEQTRLKMGKKAQQLVEKTYNWRAIAQQTEVLYEKYAHH